MRRRFRATGDVNVVADVNAAVVANVAERGGDASPGTGVSSRQHIVQRSRARKGKQ